MLLFNAQLHNLMLKLYNPSDEDPNTNSLLRTLFHHLPKTLDSDYEPRLRQFIRQNSFLEPIISYTYPPYTGVDVAIRPLSETERLSIHPGVVSIEKAELCVSRSESLITPLLTRNQFIALVSLVVSEGEDAFHSLLRHPTEQRQRSREEIGEILRISGERRAIEAELWTRH